MFFQTQHGTLALLGLLVSAAPRHTKQSETIKQLKKVFNYKLKIMQKPAVGRIVHFYPHPDDLEARSNGAPFIPAIIVQAWGDTEDSALNVRAFSDSGDAPLWRPSVSPKNHAFSTDGTQQMGYWEWPPRV